MRAEIDAGGRKVSIECDNANMSPRELLLHVAAVWSQTEATNRFQGPAIGFNTSGPAPQHRDRWIGRGAQLPVVGDAS